MSLKDRIAALIRETGPISVAQYMALALYDPQSGYYTTRATIGRGGDFITAPEVSQMFGEMLGLWCVQSWVEMGAPDPFHLIEIGPGTGTLMADAWRAARITPAFQKAAAITLIEINPGFQAQQRAALATVGARAEHAAALSAIPGGPSLILANEALDCLPARQFLRTRSGWRERAVGLDAEGALAFGFAPDPIAADVIPAHLRDAPEGAIVEWAPALESLIAEIGGRLLGSPGRALLIDYGADAPSPGDTLQAIRAHEKLSPLAAPGDSDLTAHVDFVELSRLARTLALQMQGPLAQGPFLNALGLGLRAEALARANPAAREAIGLAYNRLTAPDQMGALFKAVALSSPHLPPASGFL